MRRLATLLTAAVLCTGCVGSMLRSDEQPPDLYRLSAAQVEAATSTLPQAIAVARPRSVSSLDTDRIAVVTPDHGFNYLAGARWADAAPQMVQQLLVDALVAGGGFAAVVAAPSRVPTDLLLDVELRGFEAVYGQTDAAPRVRVDLLATVVDTRRGQRLASFESSAEVAAGRNDRRAVVAAFQQAAAAAAGDVAARARAAVPR